MKQEEARDVHGNKKIRKVRHLLAIGHFFIGHPVDDCEDIFYGSERKKRCKCGMEFGHSDFIL